MGSLADRWASPTLHANRHYESRRAANKKGRSSGLRAARKNDFESQLPNPWSRSDETFFPSESQIRKYKPAEHRDEGHEGNPSRLVDPMRDAHKDQRGDNEIDKRNHQ